MERKKFKKLVEEAIKLIPEKFLKKLDNIDIVIEDNPAPSEFSRKISLLGLYEGVPKTERENYGQVLPDKITIFQKPIEKEAHFRQERGLLMENEEEIKKVIKDTIWHEIAHHFGMDEKQVRKIEDNKQ